MNTTDRSEDQGAPVRVGSDGSGSGFVSVADILPFWRYAVGPTSGRSPAIPFYRLAPAMDFFDEAKRDLPWAGVILYRRQWWKGIETLKEYVPNGRDEGRAGNA